MGSTDEATAKLLMNNVTINFDMFGALVEYRIFGNVEGSLVVAIKVHG